MAAVCKLLSFASVSLAVKVCKLRVPGKFGRFCGNLHYPIIKLIAWCIRWSAKPLTYVCD